MRLPAGSTVGPYVIGSPIGAGGMGEVYRARDPRLGRDVAVKVLGGDTAPEPDRLQRFEQEARAAAALTHPNILTVHDVGVHEGLPFLVTELLDGQNLREHLGAGPLPPERVVALGLQLARGLAAAHAVRIVHRDQAGEPVRHAGRHAEDPRLRPGQQAERASRRALELAPGLTEAHASRGFALELGGRYDDAAREFEEALRINPSHFDALYLYARSAFSAGRIEQSAELFRRAGEARREDFQSTILLGQSLRMLGRDDEAREATREGIRRVEHVLELNPADSRALSLGANALSDDGQPERALRWSDQARQMYPDDQSVLINAACLRAKLGLKEEALSILEYVFSRGWGKRDWIEHDPDYDGLRDDPRFRALLDKLH